MPDDKFPTSEIELALFALNLCMKMYDAVKKWKSNPKHLAAFQVRIVTLSQLLDHAQASFNAGKDLDKLSATMFRRVAAGLQTISKWLTEQTELYGSSSLYDQGVALFTSGNVAVKIKEYDGEICSYITELSFLTVTYVNRTADALSTDVKRMRQELSEGQHQLMNALQQELQAAAARHERVSWQLEETVARLDGIVNAIQDLRAQNEVNQDLLRAVLHQVRLIRAGGGAGVAQEAAPGGGGAGAQPGAQLPIYSWDTLEPMENSGVLGSGAFADVRAYRHNHQEVAVKELSRGAREGLSEADVAQLMAEATLQAKLDHSRVVRVYGVAMDSSGGRVGLIMRLMDHSLHRDLTATSGATPLDMAHRLLFIRQAAEGLAYLHSKGVVHGDVKPANVMVAPGGKEVALTDFGFAQTKTTMSTSGSLTHKGGQQIRGVGTLPFMAPELFEEDEETGDYLHGPSRAADVFAWAVTAFCVLAGTHRPYQSHTLTKTAQERPSCPRNESPKVLGLWTLRLCLPMCPRQLSM